MGDLEDICTMDHRDTLERLYCPIENLMAHPNINFQKLECLGKKFFKYLISSFFKFICILFFLIEIS